MNEDTKEITEEPKIDTTKSDVVAKSTSKKRKGKRSVPTGQAHIQATFNNTIITLSDSKGNVLASSSSGACGFRGSKKGTAYAAQIASEKVSEVAKNTFSMSKADVFVKGIGLGRDAAIRAISLSGIEIMSLIDVTGVPHGGTRPRKVRRP